MKKDVWIHIYKLIKPHKKIFLLSVLLTLLSTGANLIEPLIYREAINDIAGLFVEQAKQDVRNAKDIGADDESDPITNFVQKEISTLQNKVVPQPRIKYPHSRTKVAGRTTDEAKQTLVWAVAILFLLSVTGYVLWLLGENMHVRLSCLIEQKFIKGAFNHVLRIPLFFFSKRSPAAIAKQIDQSESVSGIMNALAQKLLPEAISLLGILCIMFFQNVTLSLIAIAIIPIYLVIAWRSSKLLESGLDTYYERWEEVSGRITGAVSGIKTVKLSGAEAREVADYEKISQDAYRNYVERSLLSNKFAFWQGILTQISYALVLCYGGYMALMHKITPGDVVMFVSYLDRLYSPIDELASLWVTLQQHLASISRSFRLIDNNEEEKTGKPLELTRGLVEFENVHFHYTPEREALKGITMRFEPGKITAIVGGSGAGKTTTVDLLLKLYEPQSGRIIIDGHDLKDLDPSSIRTQIGLVAADAVIFSGTLADNIRYKKPDASDAEVMEAATAAGLKNTIGRLPDGLATQIGQNGMGLSVGEKQRVNIARTLVSKTKILVLDEATANLDYNTEAEVKKAIEELGSKSTIIIIAHRYSMIRNADYVIVLSEGAIIEQGRPDDLIKGNGWFTEFVKTVNEKEEVEEIVYVGDRMEDEDGVAGEEC